MSVVVRYDEYAEQFDVPIEQRVTVVKVVTTYEEAAAEAERLNRINSGKGCQYWAQSTRISVPDASHSGSAVKLPIDEEVLSRLALLSEQGDPAPWRATIEGRDHLSGDSFIMIGREDDRREDVYVTRDSGPADAVTLDLVAEARTYLPALLAEIRRLRHLIAE